VGGTGAVWVRAQTVPGRVMLKATHPYLGAQQVEISIARSSDEIV